MGRKRKDVLEVKKIVTIRLPGRLIESIMKYGTKQEVIEKAILEYLKSREKEEKEEKE